MLKRLIIGLSILVLFSACQSEKSPTNVVNPNPYFTSQQSVKSSSEGCQECGNTTADTPYFVEGPEKNKAIAKLLSDKKYKALRKFLMKNLQVRQDVPNAWVSKEGEKELVVIPFINFDGTRDKDIWVFKQKIGDKSIVSSFIMTYTEFPEDIQSMSVYVDPCLYQQQNGGCTSEPYWEGTLSVDSTGAVVPVQFSDVFQDCFRHAVQDICVKYTRCTYAWHSCIDSGFHRCAKVAGWVTAE